MEVKAVGKYMRVQPRKVRIVADEIRGTNAVKAVALLQFQKSKGAFALRKVLVSAMANAQENHGVGADSLKIATIMVDEGPRQKRMRARAMGRGNRILKKTSHITVVVEEMEREVAVKPHGTKAKPRPTFGSPKKSGKGKKADAPVVAAAPVEEEVVVAPEAEAPVEVVEPVAEATEAPATEAVEEATTDTKEEN